MTPSEQVTQLLASWKNGDKAAIDSLTPIVYDELRRLAERYLRDERSAATLQPTALVNEAYLRLVSQNMPDWQSRAHFFGVAARLMRQILVDHARRHRSAKRGSGMPKASIDDILNLGSERGGDLVALDDALNLLAEVDPRKAQVIELRYFGGFSIEEVARALDVSTATIGREQRMAEAWLHRELSRGA